jgi:hypothetical protein
MIHPEPSLSWTGASTMKQKHFKELLEIHRLYADESATPFIPWKGPEFGSEGLPRLMYVGKTTAGWGDGKPAARNCSRSELQQLTREFLTNCVATRRYTSLFWYHAVDLMFLLAHKSLPINRDSATKWAIPRIYWSNLIKVGGESGNAGGALRSRQLSLSARILEDEISEVSPDIIVIVSGDYARSVVNEVFGSSSWQIHQSVSANDLEFKLDFPSSPGGVYWTRHPQGWARDRRLASLEFIAENYARMR